MIRPKSTCNEKQNCSAGCKKQFEMKIALVQISPIIGDFSYNSERILLWANKAREKGCDLAIFPELALCGYPPQDLLERPAFGHGVSQYRYLTTNAELAKHVQVHNILLESLISFGLVGTVALLFLLGKIWVSAAVRLQDAHSLSSVPVFLVATSLLVHGLVSGTYYHIHSILMIAISLGFLLRGK